jgi:glycosyltransferase involved in cell wall biosynthesis
VYAGRLVREKGVAVLIEAFRQVVAQNPSARLVIAGAGPELEPLRARVARHNLQQAVQLVGHMPRPQLEHHIQTAWVQVVPSLWAEPFGRVAVEAMMRGAAVIASDTGGLAEIVAHNQTGLLVPPGNSEALAQALLDLLGNRQRSEQLGWAGRARALAEFNDTEIVLQHEAIFRRVVYPARQNPIP